MSNLKDKELAKFRTEDGKIVVAVIDSLVLEALNKIIRLLEIIPVELITNNLSQIITNSGQQVFSKGQRVEYVD